MIEKLKIACDNKKIWHSYSHRFVKNFACICYDLFIAKLNAYGLDRNALKLIYNYVGDRSQKAIVGSLLSAYIHIVYDVLQGSILGPLLFNLDVCVLFFEDYFLLCKFC